MFCCCQVTSKDSTLTDRYYRTLYSSLLSPELPESSKHKLYLSLLFKSLKVSALRSVICSRLRQFKALTC